MKKYGVEIVDRPKIRPVKELDLTGKEGEKLVRLLTKKIGGVSKSMLKQSRLNFDKIEKCE